MAKRKTPEQVIAESNARIAAAQLRIARTKDPLVRRIQDAIVALEAIPWGPSDRGELFAQAASELDKLLAETVAAANSENGGGA